MVVGLKLNFKGFYFLGNISFAIITDSTNVAINKQYFLN